MPQTGPSSSHQLAAAAVAFRRARRKFPKNLGFRARSGESTRLPQTEGSPPPLKYPIPQAVTASPSMEQMHNKNGKCVWPQWANECDEDRPGTGCAACRQGHCKSPALAETYDNVQSRKQNRAGDAVDDNETTPRRTGGLIRGGESNTNQMRRLADQERYDTGSKSTHSSGFKTRRNGKHRRCYHGRRRVSSRSPKKDDSVDQYYEADDSANETTPICHSHKHRNSKNENRNAWGPRNDLASCKNEVSATLDFPNKLHVWEHRTQQESMMKAEKVQSKKKISLPTPARTCVPLQRPTSPRSVHAKRHHHHRHNSKQRTQRNEEASHGAEVCLRPSVIKAQQRRLKLEKEASRACQNYVLSRCSGHSGLISELPEECEEEVSVIRHKDSVSILMEKFRLNNQLRDLKCPNTSNLTMTSKSKLSNRMMSSDVAYQQDETPTDRSIRYEESEADDTCRRRGNGVPPVPKSGRVANQTFREGGAHLKNLRTRLNRAGICNSPKGTPWRRAF